MNLDQWQPRSRYFRERREMAIRWVKTYNELAKGKTEGDKKEYRAAEHRTTVRTAGKRGSGVGAGERGRSHNARPVPLLQETPGLYADGI
jgi:hypothetical protein